MFGEHVGQGHASKLRLAQQSPSAQPPATALYAPGAKSARVGFVESQRSVGVNNDLCRRRNLPRLTAS